MTSVWFRPELADEIIKNDGISENIHSIMSDILLSKIEITSIVENMAGVLTNKEVDNRLLGMEFFTKLLSELPKDFLKEYEVKVISKFYIDRLKDNHKVIPPVLEGYASIIDTTNFDIKDSAEFFTILFREVPCQSQVRKDRYQIYMIINNLLEKDPKYMATLGPDFVYGVIQTLEGERDPRNLLFVFEFLQKFLKQVPLGHLFEEMFEVISCYYPVDFHPSPKDPVAVTRDDLAAALCPCLCAVPEFGEPCMLILVEKLDSTLRQAKIDSFKLLEESCKSFNTATYGPFLKALWSSIHRDIMHKTDDELKLASHKALSALVNKLATSANTDKSFETFLNGILISMQTAIAEATTVAQFVQASKVLQTTANASKESCTLITRSMIPALINYYGLKTAPKLQISSLDVIGDFYEVAKFWKVLPDLHEQVKEIPQVCLAAVSEPTKEYQLAGFRTIMRAKNELSLDLVVPFVEVLVYNIQNSHDNDLLKISVETVHVIAKKYPEQIMNLVVKGKCDLENLTQDKSGLEKRLQLLTNLASIDTFTKVIVEKMLTLIEDNDDASSAVVEALSGSISDTSLYSNAKVTQIESDHGLIESVISWLYQEINPNSIEKLDHGLVLIASTMSCLPPEKQDKILLKYTEKALLKVKSDDIFFLIIEALYSSIHRSVYTWNLEEIFGLSLNLALGSEIHVVRSKACKLVAHILNKAEAGQHFQLLYELLKSFFSSCKRDEMMCSKLITLYGWVAKALILRSHDDFNFWVQKIVVALSSPAYCEDAANAIRLIMTDSTDYLSQRHHCRVTTLYKQRMFQTFLKATASFSPSEPDTKQAYLKSWSYVLEKTPKSVLKNEASIVASLVIDSLEVDNKDLLLIMMDVLCHFVQSKDVNIAQSLQSLLPRLIKLSRFVDSMDVRIKSLECLYEIANEYPTVLLLPSKQEILILLAPSLDDKKRLVRSMAVKARTRWFLIGAPGESKEN